MTYGAIVIPSNAPPRRPRSSRSAAIVLAAVAAFAGTVPGSDAAAAADAPYPNMPAIAPIGVRIPHYMAVPNEAKAPPVDPAKGYRLQELGKGLYMITNNAYQSMFMVYDTGVVVIDAPPDYAKHIVTGIREVTDKPITHLIYSHSHADHIAGMKELGPVPTIIAQRTGTHEDVERQSEFYRDLKTAAAKALADTKVGEGTDPAARDNAWAMFDDYIDRVVIQCVNDVTPKWSNKLAAFDVYIWDQCYAMEQSLRID